MLAYTYSPPSLLIIKESNGGYYQPSDAPKLLDQVRTVMRRQHYSIRTEETYVRWIVRFIHFHKMRHPQKMDTPEIEAFLNHLAVELQVSASTQNQAFSAILFLYKHVLHKA
ncbi:MAG: site-specific integrase, partial [Deltaproteobacteria bacterium]|nr:site-specific integrase [Deltaproteobacteria bacterium]